PPPLPSSVAPHDQAAPCYLPAMPHHSPHYRLSHSSHSSHNSHSSHHPRQCHRSYWSHKTYLPLHPRHSLPLTSLHPLCHLLPPRSAQSARFRPAPSPSLSPQPLRSPSPRPPPPPPLTPPYTAADSPARPTTARSALP